MGFRVTRIEESRERLRQAFFIALGSYIEQEATKSDSWRDNSLGQMYAHLKHEIEEIRGDLGSGNAIFLIHNCIDAVTLSLMLLALVLEKNGITVRTDLGRGV